MPILCCMITQHLLLRWQLMKWHNSSVHMCCLAGSWCNQPVHFHTPVKQAPANVASATDTWEQCLKIRKHKQAFRLWSYTIHTILAILVIGSIILVASAYSITFIPSSIRMSKFGYNQWFTAESATYFRNLWNKAIVVKHMIKNRIYESIAYQMRA